MVLYIDIGNSNIVIGKGNGDLRETFRYHTDPAKSSDEYYAMLKHLFDDVDDVIIASVVPQLNTAFKTFLQRYYSITPLFIEPGVKTGVGVKTEYPREVGADLIAASAGAKHLYGDHAVIIDMGTATTITHLEDSMIMGVAITVGLDQAKSCLVSSTSKLLQFEFQPPSEVVGTNTIDALNGGFLYGHAFQVEGFAKAIKSRMPKKEAPVILTGGASKLLKSILPDTYIFNDNLVLEGLRVIYAKNRTS